MEEQAGLNEMTGAQDSLEQVQQSDLERILQEL